MKIKATKISEKNKYYFLMQQIIFISFAALLLGVSLFTGMIFFKVFAGIYIIFLLFFYYMKYLSWEYNRKKISTKRQERKAALEKFKGLLENKNFLNHHNYFVSSDNKKNYTLFIKRQKIKGFFIAPTILPLIFIIPGMNNFLSSSSGLKDFVGIYIMLFFIFIILSLIFYILDLIKQMHGALKGQGKNKTPVKLYQEKINTPKFLKYKDKIFFY